MAAALGTGGKIGLDDYLLTHTKDDLLSLAEIPLDDPRFEGLHKQYNEWKLRDPSDKIEDIGFRPTTDVGNAERLALRNLDGDNNYLIHFSEDAGWRYFADTHWKRDITSEIQKRAIKTVKLIYEEAHQCKDEDRQKALYAWGIKSQAAGRIAAMQDLVKSVPGISIEPGVWDTDPWLLNVRNGTIDLKTGELRPHRGADMITKCAATAYDSAAGCPLWEKFLDRILPDEPTRSFVQRAVGYSLSSSVREQCFFLLYGTGANGKSTFLKTLRALLSDYAGVVRTDVLLASEKQGCNASPEIAALRGLRFVSASETEGGRKLAEGLIKEITGGESLRARFLYHDDFEFQPQFKLWLAVNHLPRIQGTDNGIWRRIRRVPFNVIIPDEEQDKELDKKLMTELPGILNWVLRGTQLWLESGLPIPEQVRTAIAEYREQSDPLADYFDERYTITKNELDQLPRQKMYQSYDQWAKDNGIKPYGQRYFAQLLRDRGCGERKSNSVRFWTRVAEKGTRDEPEPWEN